MFSWFFFIAVGPTPAEGPVTAVPGNDVSRLLPTSLVIGVAAAAAAVAAVQVLL